MTETSITPSVRAYIEALERALSEVRPSSREGILEGVREELVGLGDEAARRRMLAMGDPEFIAAAAKEAEESDVSPDLYSIAAAHRGGQDQGAIGSAKRVGWQSKDQSRARMGEPRWFSVIAALIVLAGGFVIPVVGAIVGIVMVWFSTVWTTRQKMLATLVPAAAVVVTAVVAVVLVVTAPPQVPGEVRNPLVPAGFDLVTVGIGAFFLTTAVVGVWLLVIAARSRVAVAAPRDLTK